MERWRAEWNELDARISGLQPAAELLLKASAMHTNGFAFESISVFSLRPTLADVIRSVLQFRDMHADFLPVRTRTRLENSLALLMPVIGGETSNLYQLTWTAVFNATAILAGMRAEVASTLVDNDAGARRLTERAFEHLQRSIVVDEGCRARWLAAYDAGETACERLGAVHLLLHGIWAFKAHAEGERTDLVLQERLAIGKVERAADAMVLTEWKLAKKEKDIAVKSEEGMQQARLYSGSALAAIELATARYIVVVTERREPMRDDEVLERVNYRFVNIAVNPDSPSMEAKKRKQRGRRV